MFGRGLDPHQTLIEKALDDLGVHRLGFIHLDDFWSDDFLCEFPHYKRGGGGVVPGVRKEVGKQSKALCVSFPAPLSLYTIDALHKTKKRGQSRTHRYP